MISLPERQLYIFDLDDTLINTSDSYTKAQEVAVCSAFSDLPQRLINEYSEITRWFCRMIGSGKPELYFAAMLKSVNVNDESAETLLRRLLSIYEKDFWERLSVFDGAVEYLNELSLKDKNLAIVSNGHSENQRRKLAHCHLDHYFEKQTIFISGDFPGESQKPSPFLVNKACEHFNTPPSDTIFFGDKPTDIIAGNLADVTTVQIELQTGDYDIPKTATPDFRLYRWAD